MAMQLKSIIRISFYALLIGSLLFFTYLLLLICLQYIPVRYDVAFLVLKQYEIQFTHYKIAFFTHVFTSIFTLLFGWVQFFKFSRKGFLHRNLGKAYIFIVLFLAGPSGLVMSFYANGNWLSKTSFIMLSLLWIYFTYQAWTKARQKEFNTHRNFMIRSYALTLSAITLRLWKWVVVSLLSPLPMDTYILVSILGWTLNLIVAEIIILKIKSKTIP